MPDEILKELWEIKDSIARQHGYNVESLVAHLRSRERPEDERVVDLRATRGTAGQGAPAEVDKPRR